jgi:hypothetical protein
MRRDLEIDQEIWDLSKQRFLQFEAQFWTIGTRTLEIIFIISFGALWALFFLGQYQRLTIGAAAAAIASAISIIARDSKFKGYFEGYEQGFKDAGSRTLDYWDWDELGNAASELAALESILREIGETEETLSEEDKATRKEEIGKGVAMAARLFFRAP